MIAVPSLQSLRSLRLLLLLTDLAAIVSVPMECYDISLGNGVLAQKVVEEGTNFGTKCLFLAECPVLSGVGGFLSNILVIVVLFVAYV